MRGGQSRLLFPPHGGTAGLLGEPSKGVLYPTHPKVIKFAAAIQVSKLTWNSNRVQRSRSTSKSLFRLPNDITNVDYSPSRAISQAACMPIYQPNASLPSIELARGGGATEPAEEYMMPGWNRQNDIELSSFQSSSDWISPLGCTWQQPQQKGNKSVPQPQGTLRISMSSSLISNPRSLPSSPCARLQPNRQQSPIRNQLSADGVTPSSRLLSQALPELTVEDGSRHTKHGELPVLCGQERQSSSNACEVMPGSILASVESDDAENGLFAQPAITSIKARPSESALHLDISTPNDLRQGLERRRCASGEGRVSFNDKHLALLSSDDRSRLRQRLQHRTIEARDYDHHDQSSSKEECTAPSQKLPQHKKRKVASNPASHGQQHDMKMSVSSTPSTLRMSVHFDDSTIDPVYALRACSSEDSIRKGESPSGAVDSINASGDHAALSDRILSLSVCRGILPYELASELQKQTRCKLLPPHDQHSYMLNRSSRLGYRPNTAFSSNVSSDNVNHHHENHSDDDDDDDDNDNDNDTAVGSTTSASIPLINANHLLARVGPRAALEFELRFELEILQDIVQASRACLDISLSDQEAHSRGAWAARVHIRLLDLATRYATTTAGSNTSTSSGTVEGRPSDAAVCSKKITRTSVRVSQTALAQLRSLHGTEKDSMAQDPAAYTFVLYPQARTGFENQVQQAVASLFRREEKGKQRMGEGRFVYPTGADGVHYLREPKPTRKFIAGQLSEQYLPIGTIILELRGRCCRSHCNLAPFASRAAQDLLSPCCLDTRSRLTSWARAWHSQLCNLTDRRDRDACKLMPLPIVVVDGAEWLLFFVLEDIAQDLGRQVTEDNATYDGLVSIHPMLLFQGFGVANIVLPVETYTAYSDGLNRQFSRSV